MGTYAYIPLQQQPTSIPINSCNQILYICFIVPSGPPTSFNGSSLSPSSLLLSWDPPSPEERNGDITGYLLNITNLDNETVHQYRTGVVPGLMVTSLNPYTLYECVVVARTAVGIGQAPAVILILTDEDGKYLGIALQSR